MEKQKVLGIDITGTLVHHESYEWLPRMLDFLFAMRAKGWDCQAVTLWSKSMAESIIGDKAGWMKIHDPGRKGLIMRELVSKYPAGTEFAFIDDKPDNIQNVAEVNKDSVRVIGFAGSGDYLPELAETCSSLGLEFASTADDLFALFELS